MSKPGEKATNGGQERVPRVQTSATRLVRTQNERQARQWLACWRQTRDPRWRDRLLAHYEHTAQVYARRYARGDREMCLDLEQEGRLGVLTALETYQESQRASLTTWVCQCVIRNVVEYVRQRGWPFIPPDWMRRWPARVNRAESRLGRQLLRVPTEEEMAAALQLTLEVYRERAALYEVLRYTLSLDAVPSDTALSVPYRYLSSDRFEPAVEDRLVWKQVLDLLSDRERRLLEAVYWQHRSITDISAELGLTPKNGSQILQQVRRRLRQAALGSPSPEEDLYGHAATPER